MLSPCPVCGNDPDLDMRPAKDLLLARGLVATFMNPGGREFHFRDGATLQISECCNTCDTATINAFLEST